MLKRQPVIYGSAPGSARTQAHRARSLATSLAMMAGDRTDYAVMLAAVRAKVKP